MQYDTTEQLYIVMDHVPRDHVTTGNPVVLIDRLIVFDTYEVEASSQCPVKIVGRHHHFRILCETASRILHDGKCFWQRLFEHHFHLLRNILLDLIYFSPDGFAFFQFFLFDPLTQSFNLSAFFCYIVLDALFDLFCFGT